MESTDDLRDDPFLAVSAVRAAKLEKKNAELRDAVARWEKEVKRLTMANARRKASRKETLHTYFTSTRRSALDQLLSLVFNSRFPDISGVESDDIGDYLSSDFQFANDKSVSINTTPGSSIGSGDTRILSSKSPVIVLSDSSEDNAGSKEVLDGLEGGDEEGESPPRKKRATMRGKAKTAKSKVQQRYDRHRKYQM